ncbi:hypothetical protein AAVH_32784 [Aphelenchoides avenae]|nr:hypothetical protein AAVH_32784 [Aphelenchus avenae]
MERKELVQLKEDAIGGNHEKEQPSKSEQAEDNGAEDVKIEVLPGEQPEDEAASKGDEEALFLDRDALEMIFRYALANESAKRSAGTLIKRLFALRDTFARDAIVRVVKRFPEVRFAGGGVITLVKDKETAVVTVAQFVWMLRWDMLRFDTFNIGSYDKAGCAVLIKVANLFHLRELKYSTVETWSRKTVTWDNNFVPNVTHLVDQYPASLDLALALIKNNVDTLKVLDGVPLWRLKEPLPSLHLDRFVYQTEPYGPLSQDMGNLAQCTVVNFEYSVKSLHDNRPLPLSFLADVHCQEVHWNLRAFRGFESPPEGQSNVHTRQICIQAECVWVDDAFFHLRALDIEAVRRFFPSLLLIDLHIRAYHDRCVWQVRNLMHFFAKVQQFGQALASAHGEFALQQSVRMSFKRGSDVHSDTATEKAIELGFTPEVTNGTTIFKRQVEVAPGRSVTAVCTLI